MTPEVATIVEHVAQRGGVRATDILGPDRTAKTSLARQVAQFLANRMLDMGPNELGRQFERNHASVIYSLRFVEARARADRKFRRAVLADVKMLRVKLAQRRAQTPEIVYLLSLPDGVMPY